MLARLQLIGNLTADPVVKEVNVRGEKRSVTEFSIAVNNPFNKDEEPSFFNDLAAWNGTGKSIAQFCTKGSKVFVTTDVKVRRDEKDGVKRTHYNHTVVDVRFLGGGAQNDARYQDAPASETETVVEPATAPATEPATEPAAAPVETQTELTVPF
jgi:single-stranded DNA-binding protein